MTGKLYHVNFYFPLMLSDPFYIQAPNKKRLPTWCYGVAGLQRSTSEDPFAELGQCIWFAQVISFKDLEIRNPPGFSCSKLLTCKLQSASK